MTNEFVNWKVEKPKYKGYYLFATHSCVESYSNSADQMVGYYDPKSPGYAVGGLEQEKDEHGNFFSIIGWMELPKFPSQFIS